MLTDEMLPPPMFELDGPRSRGTDPVQSHLAEDRAKHGLTDLRYRVLHLVAFQGRPVGGNDLNELYAEAGRSNGWARVHFDSPRKRAGELAAAGYLDVYRHDAEGRHLPEAEYVISDKGLEVLS